MGGPWLHALLVSLGDRIARVYPENLRLRAKPDADFRYEQSAPIAYANA